MDRPRTPTRRTSLAAPSSSSSLTPHAARPRAAPLSVSDVDRPRFNTSLSNPTPAAQHRQAVLRQNRLEQQQQQRGRGTSPTAGARFQSPTTAAAHQLVNRIAASGGSGSGNGGEALELFSQLQQIVVQLSSRAVDDKRALAGMKAQLDNYARLVAEQEAMIDELRNTNSQLATELAAVSRRVGAAGGGAAPTIATVSEQLASNEFAKALVEQLRTEQRERVLMEEQHARLIEEQQRSIRNLEARLRNTTGTPVAGGAALTDERQQQATTAAAGELSARRAGGSPLSSRRAGGTPSRFAQQRAAATGGGNSPVTSANIAHVDDAQNSSAAFNEPPDDVGSRASSTTVNTAARLSTQSNAPATDPNHVTPQRSVPHTNSTLEGPTSPPSNSVEALTGAKQRDKATAEAFRRFAEALQAVRAPGDDAPRAVTQAHVAPKVSHVSPESFAVVPTRTPGLRETGNSWQRDLRGGAAAHQASPPGRAGSSSTSSYPSPPNHRGNSQPNATAQLATGGGRAAALEAAVAGRPVPVGLSLPPPSGPTARSVEELISSWRREHLSSS